VKQDFFITYHNSLYLHDTILTHSLFVLLCTRTHLQFVTASVKCVTRNTKNIFNIRPSDITKTFWTNTFQIPIQ